MEKKRQRVRGDEQQNLGNWYQHLRFKEETAKNSERKVEKNDILDT